jgi:hypothetical protein
MRRANRLALWAALAAGVLACGRDGQAAPIQISAPSAAFGPSFAEPLSQPDFPARDGAGDWLALGDGAERLPTTLDDPPVSDGVWAPILGVILAGLIWRYFQSPTYSTLYRRLFGPLREY